MSRHRYHGGQSMFYISCLRLKTSYHHSALSLWEDESANNKETKGLSTSPEQFIQYVNGCNVMFVILQCKNSKISVMVRMAWCQLGISPFATIMIEPINPACGTICMTDASPWLNRMDIFCCWIFGEHNYIYLFLFVRKYQQRSYTSQHDRFPTLMCEFLFALLERALWYMGFSHVMFFFQICICYTYM